MRSKALPLFFAAWALLAGCGPSVQDTPAGRAERLSERMVTALGLDSQQEQKARSMALALEEAQSAWSRQRSELSKAVADQFLADDFDARSLERLSTSKAAELESSRARLMLELKDFHQSLKPAQRAEAARILQHWLQKIGADA